MNENASNPANHKASSTLNWPTVALIIASGAGNFLTTKAGADFNSQEIERATREIHDLYPRLSEAVDRQKQIQEAQKKIRESLDRLENRHN